jgi:hypothetical protein
MPLLSILSVDLKPDRILEYQEVAAELAGRARDQSDPFHWTAHEVVYGGSSTLHFGTRVENFGELAQRGLPPEMVIRVLGETRGTEALREFGASTQSARTSISIDRPELSYPPDAGAATSPAAAVTFVQARAGQLEACEELIRKVAEAIPKVGDPARLTTFQTVIGNLSQYWTVRPLAEIGELDAQLPLSELLTQAFGLAEGGLIYRTGLEAVEHAERTLVIYREDLSNPPAQA